eukprot:763867-Hanusia_phi.AAC.1
MAASSYQVMVRFPLLIPPSHHRVGTVTWPSVSKFVSVTRSQGSPAAAPANRERQAFGGPRKTFVTRLNRARALANR